MTEDVKRIADILHLQGSAFIAQKRCPNWYGCNMMAGDEMPCSGESGRCYIAKAADLIEQLTAELEQVRRERDAAVWDITNSSPCFACGHFERNGGVCRGGRTCIMEMLNSEEFGEEYTGLTWQWRGVCAENGGAE